MFHHIPDEVLARMRELERMDATERREGTTALERLRQVPSCTGRLLTLIAASAPEGAFIEIGTSGGYSGLWISLACRARGRRLTTFEAAEAKVAVATETFRKAGVDDIVTIVSGDARDHLGEQSGVSFCFLDADKKLYEECYEAVLPNMVSGGLLVADNVISHAGDLSGFMDRAESDERMDTMVVPVGEGVLLARRV
ncbi:MAG: class I SAM-dependent methyltransferase [Candidatus Eisenbacteria bacterium]